MTTYKKVRSVINSTPGPGAILLSNVLLICLKLKYDMIRKHSNNTFKNKTSKGIRLVSIDYIRVIPRSLFIRDGLLTDIRHGGHRGDL